MTPVRLRFSSTLKSIYVLRYLLFSGGLAIAGAMLERLFTRSDRAGLGLLLGLAAGLFAFRSQLRPFSLPQLVMGREHLWFIRRGRDVAIPWQLIARIEHDSRNVTLSLSRAQPLLDGATGSRLVLRGLDYGTTAPMLGDLLRRAADPDERRAFPSDDEIRRATNRPSSQAGG